MHQFVPPALAVPGNDHRVSIITVIFVWIGQPIEIKYVKKHVNVEDMDTVTRTSRCASILVEPYQFNSQVCEQISDTRDKELELTTSITSATGEPSNEGRMAYGKVASRHFTEVGSYLDVIEEFTVYTGITSSM
jgi:hypothetical protein